MTTISPTRVSIYDFLYQDTQPIVSLLADASGLSLPQARLALNLSLQAVISALLAYQQRHQGQAMTKKLFGRTAVKELRKFNSMNFSTLNSTLYHRHDVAEAIFQDNTLVTQASERIASTIDSTTIQAQTLLSSVSVIVLRELAILVEYGQLNHDEVDKWFALQPQFLSASRFNAANLDTASGSLVAEPLINANNKVSEGTIASEQLANPSKEAPIADKQQTEAEKETDTSDLDLQRSVDSGSNNLLATLPPFDTHWYELTGFQPDNFEPVQDMELATGNYLKAIGRTPDGAGKSGHNDSLMFAEMAAVSLPHQRWLLQLAKISDIYLQRNRLRITSEPANAPKPPLVNLALISGNKENTPATTSETPIEYDAPTPLWKNPVILITLLVIGILGALALLKYQSQKPDAATVIAERKLDEERINERKQQDIAIVKVDSQDEPDAVSAE